MRGSRIFFPELKNREKNEPGCGGNTMFVDTTWKFEKEKKVKKSETHEDGKKSGAKY